MREFRFDKLVRDRIAKNIESGGGKVRSRTLEDQEYLGEVKKKLLEEAGELLSASEEDLPSELADVQELVNLICRLKGITKKQLKEIRAQKVKKAGGFGEKTFVESAQIPEDSSWLDYFLSQPDRYPEVK